MAASFLNLSGQPFQNNDYYDLFYADNPQAAYQRWLNQQGYTGNTTRERFFQGQGTEEYRNYLAAAPELGPNTSFLSFLDTRGPTLQQRFNQASPQQGGMDWGKGPGRLRWVL